MRRRSQLDGSDGTRWSQVDAAHLATAWAAVEADERRFAPA